MLQPPPAEPGMREAEVDTVYLGAWPRRVFERIGLFDEEQVRNQDDEFNYRLRASGGRIVLTPEIRSLYYNRSTLRLLWRLSRLLLARDRRSERTAGSC